MVNPNPDTGALIPELQARLGRLAGELAEARDVQAVTTGILKIISGSGFELDTVLQSLSRSAATLCKADEAIIFLRVAMNMRPDDALASLL
jgi:hypothetical protein